MSWQLFGVNRTSRERGGIHAIDPEPTRQLLAVHLSPQKGFAQWRLTFFSDTVWWFRKLKVSIEVPCFGQLLSACSLLL
jgi:hypothetical protein